MGVHAREEEAVARADHRRDGPFERIAFPRARNGAGPVHLLHFLE